MSVILARSRFLSVRFRSIGLQTPYRLIASTLSDGLNILRFGFDLVTLGVFNKEKALGIAKVKTLAYAAVSKSVALITRGWTLAQHALNLAMTANPIGLVIAGISALAVGGYLLIRHWDRVKTFFLDLWERVKPAFLKGISSLKDLFLTFSPVPFLIKKWHPMLTFFKELWQKITGIFQGGIGSLTESLLAPLKFLEKLITPKALPLAAALSAFSPALSANPLTQAISEKRIVQPEKNPINVSLFQKKAAPITIEIKPEINVHGGGVENHESFSKKIALEIKRELEESFYKLRREKESAYIDLGD